MTLVGSCRRLSRSTHYSTFPVGREPKVHANHCSTYTRYFFVYFFRRSNSLSCIALLSRFCCHYEFMLQMYSAWVDAMYREDVAILGCDSV